MPEGRVSFVQEGEWDTARLEIEGLVRPEEDTNLFGPLELASGRSPHHLRRYSTMLNLPCHTVRRDRRCLAVAKAVITLTVLVGGLISFGTGPAYARDKALVTHDKLLELLVRTLEDVTDIKRSLEEPLPELSETTMLRDKLKGISKTHEIDFKGMHAPSGGGNQQHGCQRQRPGYEER